MALSATVDEGMVPMPPKGDSTEDAARPKRSKTLKVSNQIPAKRRREIEKALDAHDTARPEWDRLRGAKQHRFFRKRVKPGTQRQIEMPLLDVKLGDAWR